MDRTALIAVQLNINPLLAPIDSERESPIEMRDMDTIQTDEGQNDAGVKEQEQEQDERRVEGKLGDRRTQ